MPQHIEANLKTLSDARREIAKVYADVRKGQIYSQDGNRMVQMLRTFSEIVNAEQIESRIEALEAEQVQELEHGAEYIQVTKEARPRTKQEETED